MNLEYVLSTFAEMYDMAIIYWCPQCVRQAYKKVHCVALNMCKKIQNHFPTLEDYE